MNNYNCINDYSNFVPNLSTINGINPSNSIGTNQNDFLFFRNTRFAHIDNNIENEQKLIDKLRNPFNTTNHKNNQNNQHLVEGFEAPLIDTVSSMKKQITEANQNMNFMLQTDSSLKNFEHEQSIKQKELEDKKYIEKQKQQDAKMESINKKMSEIEVLRNKVMTEFDKLKGIQSQISGKKLSVNMLDNNGTFQIKGNNKCLLYKNDNNYNFGQCYAPDDKQHFKMNLINNSNAYRYVLKDSISNTSLSDLTGYPFYVVQPVNDNKQCLQAGAGDDAVNISVQPCDISDAQKWNKVDKNVGCKLI